MTLKANILMLMILIFRIAVAQETGSITDSRNNHIYRIVKIGKQWWMAENLNYLIKTDPGCYAKKLSNCFKYGRLYTWNTAMNGDSSSNTNPSGVKGICPLGWHLPSDAEWMELEKSLGMTSEEANSSGFRGSDEGNKLKEADTFHWKNQNINVTNSTGFTALPSGYRDNYGRDRYLGSYGYYWSCTKYNEHTVWVRLLTYDESKINRFSSYKEYGYSVRCLMD